jgi:riboflavin kinase
MTTTTRVTPINYDESISRELIVGPNEPISPFPIKLLGWVQMGFGRGSKDLGCPTGYLIYFFIATVIITTDHHSSKRLANLPDSAIIPYQHQLGTGVYYGYATILHHTLDDTIVHPMVMSIGWNPTYNNNKKTAEVHILHKYQNDFYGKELRVIILGYIRPEFKYPNFGQLLLLISFLIPNSSFLLNDDRFID